MASIYVRRKQDGGSWRYERVVEIRGRKTGDIAGPFFSRPCIKGKQTWHDLQAATFTEAKAEAAQFAKGVDAHRDGIHVPEIEQLGLDRTKLTDAVDKYLGEKANKAPRTVAAYRTTLLEFIEGVNFQNAGAKVIYLDQITTAVLRRYLAYLQDERQLSPKTIDTRVNIVFFLLKRNKIEARIPMEDLPAVEEEPAVPYSNEEIKALFEPMDAEQKLRYRFFLGSACREREVAYAAWNDISWSRGEYTVRRKEDVGFTPKSHESRTVPLPKVLLAELRARFESKDRHSRWVFTNGDGTPEGHFLDKLKRIAWHAGLNCGHCKTTHTVGRYENERQQVEVSCKDKPVCEHFILHRFRKTCATRWVEANIPLPKIQKWLGHRSLVTTQKYLGDIANSKFEGNINEAFGD
jgi:integrase